MKFNYIKALLAVAPVMVFSACMDFDSPSDEFTEGTITIEPKPDLTGDADKLDVTTAAQSEEELGAALDALTNNIGMIRTAMYSARGSKDGTATSPHAWQYTNAMSVDPYAGFFVNAQTWGGKLASTGSYYFEYHDGPYGEFSAVRNQLGALLNSDAANKFPEMKAVALLIFNYVAANMTDIYGTIPYSDFKKNKETNPFEYNKGIDIYEAIIKNLTDINACLKNYENRPEWYKTMAEGPLLDFDAITQDHTFESYRLFANSLKLRLAMHLVKYDPVKAKTYAEEAVADGVIETYAQEVGFMRATNVSGHPMNTIAEQWGDSRMSAQFYTLLKSLGHPLVDIWFDTNPGAIVNNYDSSKRVDARTGHYGIRAGVPVASGQGLANNRFFAYSTIRKDGVLEDGTRYTNSINFSPIYFMKLSEVEFLRAEGALRGWNMGGDARSWYEKGIRDGQIEDRTTPEVTHHWADYVDEYMTLENPVPFTYIDPMDEDNNEVSPTKIGVAWNDGDSQEVKLEKIITQKYIAAFPSDSYEAWTDLRRTGYPRLLDWIYLDDYSDGSLHDGDIIRRIPLPGRDTSLGMADINNSGLEALGGEDKQGTRVFWDTMAPNF